MKSQYRTQVIIERLFTEEYSVNCQKAKIARNVQRGAVFQSKVAKKTFSGCCDLSQDVNSICKWMGNSLEGVCGSEQESKWHGQEALFLVGWSEVLSRQGMGNNTLVELMNNQFIH